MPLNAIKTRYIRHEHRRVCQGDILRDITLVEWAEETDDDLEVRRRLLPYVIVVSQDCDLELDFRSRSEARDDHDKCLQSVLLAPAYEAEKLRAGTHLEDLNLKMRRINSDEWGRIKNHNVERYHFLPAHAILQVPELVLDFKHYLTGPRDIIYARYREKSYVASLGALFREDLSLRFARYLSRIGLPELAEGVSATITAEGRLSHRTS